MCFMFGVPKNGQMNYAMLLLPKHCKTDRPTKQLQIRGPFFSAWQQNKTFYPLSHTVIARSAFMCVLVSMHMAPLSLRTSSPLITHWQKASKRGEGEEKGTRKSGVACLALCKLETSFRQDSQEALVAHSLFR